MTKKNFLIIGGSSGIGREVVKILSSGQNKIFATYREKPEYLDSSDVLYFSYDSDKNEFLVDLPEILDGIVYCPGTINLKPFQKINENEILKDFEINALGAVRVIQSCLEKLKRSEDGASIVLFSTIAVKIGMPFHSSIAMAKGAVEGLTRSLAAEFAPRIRVNAIAPSLTNTRLADKLIRNDKQLELAKKRHPLNQIGQPEDIAHLVVHLLDEKSKWISGQIFHIDGGMSSIKVFN